MIMVAVAVLILLAIPLLGGDLRRLAMVHFRGVWLIFLALALQILVISIIYSWTWLPLELIHNATYVLAGIFVILNWRIPGVLILAAGAAMNGFTIMLNGGTLPASPTAYEHAGLDAHTGDFENSAPLENPKLSFLGDIFYVPEGWPFANVFSPGDIVIWVGMFVAAYAICVPPERRLWPFRRAPAHTGDTGTDGEPGGATQEASPKD